MLEKSDTSISDTLKAFNAFDLEAGFVAPTETAMRKSIMDATASMRDYLYDTKFHDYTTQGKGQKENGVLRKAYFVRPQSLVETNVTLDIVFWQ